MINKVILIGRLGNDPEVKYTPSGDAVANFSLATTEKWKNKNGEQQEKTEWSRIVAWRRLGEICGEYLTKGQLVYVEGKLQTRSWEKDGSTHYTTEIVISEMKMLSKSDPKPDPQNYRKEEKPVVSNGKDDDIPF